MSRRWRPAVARRTVRRTRWHAPPAAPGLTLPVCDTFTGADGSAPDTSRWTRVLEGDGAIDVQGNQLSLRGPAGLDEARVSLNISATGDQEFLGIVECGSDNSWLYVMLRASGFGAAMPTDTYLLEFTGSGGSNQVPYLYRRNAGTPTGLANAGDGLGAMVQGERRWVRFQCFGTGATVTLRMRQWPVGTAEPSTWGIDHPDSDTGRILSGVPALVSGDNGRYLVDDVCYAATQQASPPVLTDQGTGGDALAVAAAVPLADQGTASDALQVAAEVFLQAGTPGDVGVELLTSGGSTTDGTSYTTASVTPTADRVLLLVLDASRTTVEPTTPTITGNGLTWELHSGATNFYKPSGTAFLKLFVFRAATGASPSAGAITVDFGATTHTGARWDVISLEDVALGNNGADAVVQSSTASDQVGNGLDLQVPLNAPAHAANRAIAFFGLNFNAAAIGHRAGWTELSDDAHSGPSQDLETQWRSDSFETTASGTNNSGTAGIFMGGIALELAAVTVTNEGGRASDTLLVEQGAEPKTLTDQGTGSDQLQVQAAAPLADSATAADALQVDAAVPLADAGTGADALQVETGPTPKTLTDQGTGSDQLTVAAQISLGDSASGAEQLPVAAALALTDAAAAADAVRVFDCPPGAPEEILTLTNLTGVVDELCDDPTSPDAAWLDAADPSAATDLRVGFLTPATAPGAGGPRTFQVAARKTSIAGAPNPIATLELWEDGAFRRQLTQVELTVTAPGSQLITGTFDAGDLTDPTGGNVEARVHVAPELGGGYGGGYEEGYAP